MSEDGKIMFKKKSSASSFRKRRIQVDSSSSEDETKVMKKGRKVDNSNPLIQRSARRARTVRSVEKHSSEEDEDVVVSFKSKKTGEREGPSDMGATAVLETETAKDRDAQAIYERTLQANKGCGVGSRWSRMFLPGVVVAFLKYGGIGVGVNLMFNSHITMYFLGSGVKIAKFIEMRGQADDKIYRGLNNYSQFYEKRDTAQGNAASGSVRKGPVRAPDHIRSTVRWDYQPDLCKDFKETGYCGFGDSCKFLHDRTDYKFGWQLELENQKTTRGFNDSDENYEIPSDDEHLPFKCLFCRQSFTDPIVTRCKHYFCEKCALGHFAKTKRCYVCGENTNGMFNPAKEIIARLEQGKDSDEG